MNVELIEDSKMIFESRYACLEKDRWAVLDDFTLFAFICIFSYDNFLVGTNFFNEDKLDKIS